MTARGRVAALDGTIKDMNRDQLLAAIKRTTEANGGVVPGERAFFAQTQLTRTTLRRAGFPTYGAAVQAAGFKPNELKRSIADDQLFGPLAQLVRDLGHFPTPGERAVARYNDATFAGESALSRRGKIDPLQEAPLSWCRTRTDFGEVATILESTKPARSVRPTALTSVRPVVGYVYLMRYGASGRDFKIGHSDNVQRRHAQIDMLSPSDVRVVHSIETDDPEGIEKYWHQRFADRRVKTKEVFRLRPDDVAAFKRRRYQ